jgi:hypothetical protein
MTTKDDIHRLIDELPESNLPDALRLLEGLRCGDDDPVLKALLLAPLDDEPETDEERLAVEEAMEDLRQGRVVSMEEIKREFGL